MRLIFKREDWKLDDILSKIKIKYIKIIKTPKYLILKINENKKNNSKIIKISNSILFID
jgi:hypothetical protein